MKIDVIISADYIDSEALKGKIAGYRYVKSYICNYNSTL